MTKTNFNLSGGVKEHDGKWEAFAILNTPDGLVTELHSGYVFDNKEDAAMSAEEKVHEILKEFTTKHGVEVMAKNGQKLS